MSGPDSYPFALSVVSPSGSFCGLCAWNRFCIGCVQPCSADAVVSLDPSFVLAIDWTPTAFHLYYLHAEERKTVEVRNG